MHPKTHPSTPPWNEVLRAAATDQLHQSVFAFRFKLATDRLEPRTVAVLLVSGLRSTEFEPMFICPCGGIAQGRSGQVKIDDVSTSTGAAKFIDSLIGAMRSVRAELKDAADPLLRTVASELHANLLRQLCVHATRWNLPPYARLGRSRARPAECWHRA